MGLLPAAAADVRQDGHGRGRRPLRGGPGARQGGQGRPQRRRAGRGRPAPAGRGVQGHHRRRDRARVPPGPHRAAHGRHRGRVRLLGQQAGDRLPAQEQDRRLARHRRQHPGHGVRQQGRRLGHRGRLHPQPGQRRARPLRRLPGQRPGRGRGGRDPQHHEAGGDGRGPAAGLGGAPGAPADPGAPLPRHVRHRVHRRAGQAVAAPDPGRQAHRLRRVDHGPRHARRGPDRRRHGHAAPGRQPARGAVQEGHRRGRRRHRDRRRA